MLVTKQAPNFTSQAVLGSNEIVQNFELYKNMGKKGTVLFFWPLDFTFVCPSEIIAFDKRVADFRSKGVEVIGVSVDSQFTHLAWKNIPAKEGGIGKVSFTMVADITKSISKDYDVLLDSGVALRGSFLIDKDKVVRHSVINDLPLGRNIDDMLRMVDALHFFEENGEVCPAGWHKGDEGMKPSTEGVARYLAKHANDL